MHAWGLKSDRNAAGHDHLNLLMTTIRYDNVIPLYLLIKKTVDDIPILDDDKEEDSI